MLSEGDEDGCAFWIFICFVNPLEKQHLIAGFFLMLGAQLKWM